jgi:hypothetical protein
LLRSSALFIMLAGVFHIPSDYVVEDATAQ